MKQQPTKERKPFFQRLLSACSSFTSLSLLALAVMMIYSVLEISLHVSSNSLEESTVRLIKISLIFDLKFWLTCFFPLLIVYIPVHIFKAGLARIILSTFILVFFATHLMLVNYFSTSLVLLGADFFSYSLSDIKQTVGASGSITLLSVSLFFSMLVPVILSLIYIPKKIKLDGYSALVIPALVLLSGVIGVSDYLDSQSLKSDFSNSVVTNKSQHFYNSANLYFFDSGYETDIYASNYLLGDEFKSVDLRKFEYTSDEYPFMHKAVDEDVLSPFFKTREKAPNIVIIIVEGLGRSFTNKEAYLGNFTPFLDSLASKSLYWKNFLSNGGRTFAVLPSLLGSLPFGKNGYLELGNDMPDQLSLVNILKHNGYRTSFYYGGDAGFDNMKGFLEKNDLDELRDENSFPSGFKKLPAYEGYSWGYGDRELYRYFLNSRSDDTAGEPQFSVLLTVTTHNPFLINEQEEYHSRFKFRMEELGFDEEKKQRYSNYKDQYATILYADDALKQFFQEYQNRDDYENTVFLITGDHRIPEIPLSTKIDRFHVPLLIFSPMLKRSSEIAAVSSHFDVAPSLLNFLAGSYKFKIPRYDTWMGHGLDTIAWFQSTRTAALMQTKTDMVDFVMGEYHLNGDVLYRLTSGMNEVIVEDPVKKEQLQNAFNLFRLKNARVIKGARMIPDSVYKKFAKTP